MENKRINPIIPFILCYISYTSIYISRLNFTVAQPNLLENGILNASEIGLLGTVFSVVYACGRLFNSALSDRIAPYIMIASGLFAAGIANIGSGFLLPFAAMAFLWAINAYGQSMLWGSILRVVSAMYDIKTAKMRMTIMVTTLALGNIIAILLNTWLIEEFGVSYAYVVPAVLNLILAPLVFFIVRKVPFVGKSSESSFFSSFKLFLRPEIRNMLIPVFFHGFMKDNVNFWMATYFVMFFEIDLKASAYFVLLIPAIGLLGRLIYGPIYRLCRERENLVTLIAFGLSAVSSIPLVFLGVPPILAALMLGIIYAAISLANTSFLSIYPLHYTETGDTASVSGIMDFMTYIGAGIGSAVYGFIIDAMSDIGQPKMGYILMYASWILLSLLSAAVMALIFRKDLKTA